MKRIADNILCCRSLKHKLIYNKKYKKQKRVFDYYTFQINNKLNLFQRRHFNFKEDIGKIIVSSRIHERIKENFAKNSQKERVLMYRDKEPNPSGLKTLSP